MILNESRNFGSRMIRKKIQCTSFFPKIRQRIKVSRGDHFILYFLYESFTLPCVRSYMCIIYSIVFIYEFINIIPL